MFGEDVVWSVIKAIGAGTFLIFKAIFSIFSRNSEPKDKPPEGKW